MARTVFAYFGTGLVLMLMLLAMSVSCAAPASGQTLQNGTTSHMSGFEPCDILTAAGLEDRLLFPDNPAYSARINSYWSASVRARPWCIIQPRSVEEVSRTLKSLKKLGLAGNWDIAVRSGGHSHWLSNNVKYGVTIDLGLVNQTIYDKSTGLASIGPGANWGSVFEAVEQYGLSVTGARDGNVGVGGFLLGGGNSFHSGRRGFGCDDVRNYEVVLASGEIISANATINPDLFKALKGGSNNFGIITRFDMATFESGELWGGARMANNEYKADILEHFVRFTENSYLHPEDSEVIIFAYQPAVMEDPYFMFTTVNTDGLDDSPSFSDLETIPTFQAISKKATYSSFIKESIQPVGDRSVWFTTTTKNNLEVLTKFTDLHEAFVADTKFQVAAANFATIFVIQPLPTYFADLGVSQGGNVLGLDTSATENQVLYLFEVKMKTEEEETLLYNKLAAVFAEFEKYAASLGADAQWRYLNYADPSQDPFKSYGSDSITFLSEVARKYDPTGIFQTKIPGGFKLSRMHVE